ncbi:MAG: hypothetical protein QMD14_03800 [Candidatus Aenigmarchaeota archaeon]|nr:hypothetical protein [Candidatus Aenigmarchaeota archaeon]
MPLTIADLMPLALCLATQELLDTKRFRKSFCDNLLLGRRDDLQLRLLNLKRELNLSETGRKFFDGYKATIISNLDKIIGLVSAYTKVNPTITQHIVSTCKNIMGEILLVDSFEKISEFESKFRSEVTLQLFRLMKEARM